MENLSLMEKFANPELFDSLTMGEKAAGGGITTLMGMGVTFVILILLAGVIYVMARVLNTTEKKPKGGEGISVAEGKATAQPNQGAMVQTTDNQGELIAVIMAAIASFEGNSVTSNLIIRKINRVAGPALAWNTAGQQECIASRKI